MPRMYPWSLAGPFIAKLGTASPLPSCGVRLEVCLSLFSCLLPLWFRGKAGLLKWLPSLSLCPEYSGVPAQVSVVVSGALGVLAQVVVVPLLS